MKPVNFGGHAAYQDHVLTLMREYYPDPDALSDSTWTIIDQFWNLDLSMVDVQMADRYSVFGSGSQTLPTFPQQNDCLKRKLKSLPKMEPKRILLRKSP